jgi:hypothetical protein
MCEACRLDRAVRKEKVSKRERERKAKEWVEEINVQNYIFFGRALATGAECEEEEEEGLWEAINYAEYDRDQCYESDEEKEALGEFIDSDEYDEDRAFGSVKNGQLDPSEDIPNSLGFDWDSHPDLSSASHRASSSTAHSSKLSIRTDLSAYLDQWITDLFDRTLEGQLENRIFTGSADDNPTQELCPLCREPLGDPKYQHLLQCQYAYDERERMARLWRH